MYPEQMVAPMRQDLTQEGVVELRTAQEVEQLLGTEKGTILVVVNSVCGCAAGAARPGVKHSLKISEKKPEKLLTVFAGVDFDAVNKVREMCLPYPPSSPAIALFENGNLIHFVERHHIEGRDASMIADHLKNVYEEYCS